MLRAYGLRDVRPGRGIVKLTYGTYTTTVVSCRLDGNGQYRLGYQTGYLTAPSTMSHS